jgi:hypothetical protein
MSKLFKSMKNMIISFFSSKYCKMKIEEYLVLVPAYNTHHRVRRIVYQNNERRSTTTQNKILEGNL